jgi:hypothetical protein
MVSRYGQWRLLRSSESTRPFFAERKKIITDFENGKPVLRVNYQIKNRHGRAGGMAQVVEYLPACLSISKP